MPAYRTSHRSEAVCCSAILAAGVIILWQQRTIARLADIRLTASGADAVQTTLLAAQRRVDGLEKQLAGAPKAAPTPPAAVRLGTEQVKKLQLRVEATRARESVRAAYGPLIKALGLDAATAAQFEGIIARERLTARDALVAAQAQGIQSIAGYKAAVEEAVGRDDEQLSTLLNPAGFAQFDAYRQTLPEQQTVASLAEHLAGTSTPLSEGQQGQLVQLIDQLEPAAYRQNQAFLSVIGMDAAPLTPAILSAAPSILAPPQASALGAMEASWVAKAQLQQSLHPAPAARSSP